MRDVAKQESTWPAETLSATVTLCITINNLVLIIQVAQVHPFLPPFRVFRVFGFIVNFHL